MNNKTQKIFHGIAFICIIIFCFSLTPRTFQNDTFYTIKIGEHIMENGIDMKDPFSWHEGLPYTYPHWAYDVITYFIYNIGGFHRSIFSNSLFLCYSWSYGILYKL